MIKILTKTRKEIATVDLDELIVEINIENYSWQLLLLNRYLQEIYVKDFRDLWSMNEEFAPGILENILHVLMQRYGLIVDYGVEPEAEDEAEIEEKVEQEVPY